MTLEFTPINVKAPRAINSAFGAIDDKIYAHGGVKVVNSVHPESRLWCYCSDRNEWRFVNSDGPHLSNHKCFTEHNRYLHLVGGFDGHTRTHSVWTLDTRCKSWFENRTEGFPRGGGLSSHTVTPVIDAGSVMITGRLGGLRTQRRSATVIKLKRKDSDLFEYQEMATSIASRSGHSATAITRSQLMVVGGRESQGFDFETISTSRLFREYADLTIKSQPYKKPANQSFKNHVGLLCENETVILHGGHGFNALHSDPHSVVQCYSTAKPVWTTIDCLNSPPLASHEAVNLEGKILVMGGFGVGRVPNKTVYSLKCEGASASQSMEDSD